MVLDSVTIDGMQKENIILKLQIINKKIDTDKLHHNYYSKLRRDIKNQINKDADVLLINLIPKKEINEKYKVESLMYLQREFTDIIIKPTSTVKNEELKEWADYFKPKLIMNTI